MDIMKSIVYNVEEIKPATLKEFLFEQDYSVIFHDPKMINVFSKTPGYKPVFLAIFEDDKIKALLSGVIFSEFSWPLSKLTSRCIIIGGPLYSDPKYLSILANYFSKIIKGKTLYTKITNFFDRKDLVLLKNFDYKWVPHLNFIFQLTKGEEVLWLNISSTRRKQIKRGMKRGVTVQVGFNVENFSSYYNILKLTYKNAGLPLQDKAFFENVIYEFSDTNQVLFISVFAEKKLIGHRIILLHKNRMHDWYAGALHEYYEYYPNDIAVWEALKWGCNNGYEIFDFGGAGHPDKPYGVREFKKKFGGEMVNYGIYEKVNSPVKNFLLQLVISTMSLLKNSKAKLLR